MLYECGQERIPVAAGRATWPDESINPQFIWGDDEGYTVVNEEKPPNCRSHIGMHFTTESFL